MSSFRSHKVSIVIGKVDPCIKRLAGARSQGVARKFYLMLGGFDAS